MSPTIVEINGRQIEILKHVEITGDTNHQPSTHLSGKRHTGIMSPIWRSRAPKEYLHCG